MQFTQTSTFSFSPIASGSNNDWSARPTQAVNTNATPNVWSFGSAALDISYPNTTPSGYDFLGPKSNEAGPVQGLVARPDQNSKLAVLDNLAFLDHPHTPPAATAPSSFPASESVVKLCARCLSGCTDEDGPEACPILHAPPIEAWIRGDKAIYPVLYYPCCNKYRLAIPGLRLRCPFDPVCRWGPHIPAD